MRKKYREPETAYANRRREHRTIADGLELPKDIACGAVIVTVTGRRALVLENYKGIVSFDEQCIRIQTKDGIVSVSGEHLKVDYYTDEEMKLIGLIRQISYEG